MSIFDLDAQAAFLKDIIISPPQHSFPDYLLNLLSQHFGYHNIAFLGPNRQTALLPVDGRGSVPAGPNKEVLIAVYDAQQAMNPLQILEMYNEYYFALDYMTFSRNFNYLQDTSVLTSDNINITAGEEYLYYLNSRSLYHFLSLYLKSNTGNYLGRLAFSKYKDEGGFTSQEIDILTKFSSYISYQYERYLRENQISRHSAIMDYAFLRAPIGIAYLDKIFNIMSFNPYMEQLCTCICQECPELAQKTIPDPISAVVAWFTRAFDLPAHRTQDSAPFCYESSSGRYDFHFFPCVVGQTAGPTVSTYILYISYLQKEMGIYSVAIESNFARDHHLTPREIDVLRCVRAGLSTKEISSTLFITTNTVKAHLSSIFRKTGVNSRSMLLKRVRDDYKIP